MKNLIFNVEVANENDKAIREATRLFTRAGVQVVSTEVGKALLKRAGIGYRNIDWTFADGQTVTMSVKTTGDVFEVKVNGAVVPLRHQDDQLKAILEIGGLLDKKRVAFQRALARIRVPLPASVRVSRTAMLTAKTEKRDALREAVSIATQELAEITGEAVSG